MRRILATIAAVAMLVMTPMSSAATTAGTSARERDRQAALRWIASVLQSEEWRAWISYVSASDGPWYEGSQCSGRWRIPVWIVYRESRCLSYVRNPNSTAGGAYQMIQGTWNASVAGAGLPQYVGMNASMAPLWVQHEAAKWLWDGGRGCGHWMAC